MQNTTWQKCKGFLTLFAKSKVELTRLGKLLLFLYLILVLLGFVGLIYSAVILLEKLFIPAIIGSSLPEIIVFMLVSLLTIRVFIQESYQIFENNIPQKIPVTDEVTTGFEVDHTNVIYLADRRPNSL